MTDPELDELFSDAADREVVELLSSARPATPPLDPHFRNYLRTQLMAEARKTLPRRERAPWFSWRLPSPPLAMAAVAAGFLIVLGFEIALLQRGGSQAPVAADIHLVNGKSNVATIEPIKIPFSGPVDKAAVEVQIQIEPATDYTTRWDGNTLVIVPRHPLAANTNYTVKLKPVATPQPNQPAPSAQPQVVVHFVTAPPPTPPVVAPTYNSQNLVWSGDSPITEPGAVGQASWTPDGEILVTRPVSTGQAQGAQGSASASGGQPSSSATGTDIWLMSPKGSFLQKLASGGRYPAAAPAGGLFAFWQMSGNRGTLRYGALDGSGGDPVALATIDGAPDRAPVWLGKDRVAYLDAGRLRVVDLHGAQVQLASTVNVSGSLAGSPDGTLIAAETLSGSSIYDAGSGKVSKPLPQGATGFSWSSSNDLAFVIEQPGNPQLRLLAHDQTASTQVYAAPVNRSWTDLSWSPDGHAVLFASRPASAAPGEFSRTYLINADGQGGPVLFGGDGAEYAAPRWSPSGTMVLFSRADEGSGISKLWVANVTVQPSALDRAENSALAEVDTFMQARLKGDLTAAQAELDANGLAKYQSGAMSLASPSGQHYARRYVVSVQLISAGKFLVGLRLVLADTANRETSYVDEHLTVIAQGPKFVIDDIVQAPAVQLGKGPTVVSVQVQANKPGPLVLVQFDSDLDPSTITSASVFVRDDSGQVRSETPTYDRTTHLVTLSVKLKPGNTYRLVVTTSVTDINGHTVAQQFESPIQPAQAGGG